MMKVFLLLALTVALRAAPPTPEMMRGAAELYLAKKEVSGFTPGFTMAEGLTAQAVYVERLTSQLGPPIGYKVGLVTRQNQERMGAKGPVRGVLLKAMLREGETTLPAKYGARPMAEADLVVVVKDEGINEATTIADAATHLKELVAFIELVDATATTNQVMDAALLTALNVGARAGVLGERRSFTTPGLAEAMARMRIVLKDESGQTLAEAVGSEAMGHPLQALLWLIEDLKRADKKLRAGDILSLGSPARPQAIRPGQKLTLSYEGLPGGAMRAAVTLAP